MFVYLCAVVFLEPGRNTQTSSALHPAEQASWEIDLLKAPCQCCPMGGRAVEVPAPAGSTSAAPAAPSGPARAAPQQDYSSQRPPRGEQRPRRSCWRRQVGCSRAERGIQRWARAARRGIWEQNELSAPHRFPEHVSLPPHSVLVSRKQLAAGAGALLVPAQLL